MDKYLKGTRLNKLNPEEIDRNGQHNHKVISN